MIPAPLEAADVSRPIRSAVVGAGFVGRGLVHRLLRRPACAAPLVVNRNTDRAVRAFVDAGHDEAAILASTDVGQISEALDDGCAVVTDDPQSLENLDLDVVIEATGALDHGMRVMVAALQRGISVVSMNAEADALLGHRLSSTAVENGSTYSIGDGDQPGVILRLIDEARGLGLDPTIALNCKRYLDPHQSTADSRPYSDRDGTSVTMTTAFGDGTKMHIENVVVANLSGLVPASLGTKGLRSELATIAEDANAEGFPDGTVHFTLGGDFGGGVLVLARSGDPDFDAPYLRYWKLGDGPLYPLFRPYHLIYLEAPATVEQLAIGGPPLGRRTDRPVAVCVALAKRDLRTGEPLEGIGGDTCYGVAADLTEAAELLPVGLAQHAVAKRDVARDKPVHLTDVDLDEDALLVRLWRGSGAITDLTSGR